MFSSIVEMYRAFGRPVITDGTFTFDGAATPDTLDLIKGVKELPHHFGNFEVDEIGVNHFSGEFNLPSSEVGRFHASISDFISVTPSLCFGELPKEFYIQDLDFYSGDEASTVPEVILQLKDVCRLVKGLSALASETDTSGAAQGAENRLLFVLAADGKSPAKTLALPIKISADDLGHNLPHVKLVELLSADGVRNDIHIEEKRSIMRLAVAEVIANPDASSAVFSYLIRQWKLVLEKYRHNVLAFVNQYAFEKVRKEIATAEIDHATKLSGVLGDIAGKLLALPVSFAAIILLRKATTQEEFWVIFFGLITVSIIFGGVLWNQWLQVKRLRGSFDLIFGQYNEDAFPKKLRQPIATAKKNMSNQYKVLKSTFIVFGVIAALPTLGAAYVLLTPIPWSLADACFLFGIR
ncbi:hypothetical protein [Duganella sp. BuS-21]|uniref:hypothetical protein n=1 Tax=Duganella sp. BuS-21 TaxID=2943848 RepID=UPI0035A6297D